jgi:Tfp pilus assembly protein PilO
LVALDLVVLFAIYQPLVNRVAEAQHRRDELWQKTRDQQVRVDLLKKYQTAMPQTGKGLEDFMTNRIPPRREAYSITAHLIHKVADAAHVKILSMSYHLESEHKDPLQRLAIELNVQGQYAGLLKFAHALETANDVILIRDFFIAPGTAGDLSLHLGADIYLTP